MRINLEYQRQNGPSDSGRSETHALDNVGGHALFLEMFDTLNEELFDEGEEPLAFDLDCREGTCGQCGTVVSGDPHEPKWTTTCQLHMRTFEDGDTITSESWRSEDFLVTKDPVVDRSAFDHIAQVGDRVSVNTGAAPEAHSQLIPKSSADRSFEAAAHIGCDTCVTACPNGSTMLFASAEIVHLGFLPQGQPECRDRVINILAQQNDEGPGGCTNVGACASVYPKEIPLELISLFNRDPVKPYGHKTRQR